MAASVEYGNVMKEKEDDLSVFFELRNREMGKNDFSLSLQNFDDFDALLGSKPMVTSAIVCDQKEQTDEYLDSENSKTDYDWLLSTPCIPMAPSSFKNIMKANGNSKSQITVTRSKLSEPPVETASRSNLKSARREASSSGSRSSSAGTRRPSSGGSVSATSRPATPTGRPILPAITKPLRSSTPTSRATVTSNNVAAAPKRSSTPSYARSSTPTARPSILAASNSTSRNATPTCGPSSSSSILSTSASTGRSTTVTKSADATLKNPVPSRGTSPTAKSRPLASLSERPALASKERPSAPIAQLSSVETSCTGKPRQRKCSPLQARVSGGNSQSKGIPVIVKSRKYFNNDDEVNPILMGTQMVERVVNMRKLAPPKQDEPNSNHTKSSGKSLSSHSSSGFGRSLSKKSLEMAMRHMDIRPRISGHMRALMKDVPASSVYSVRSESTKLTTTAASDSGLATSSDASSEHSVNNNSYRLDGSEADYIDHGSEGGHSSPRSQQT